MAPKTQDQMARDARLTADPQHVQVRHAARPPRRVTSVDVARASGLSRTTVSYVLNDTPNQSIPEETRARVLKAAAELGYAPSATARALRSGRSDVVLCLLPDWPIGDNAGALLERLSESLAQRGLTMVSHHRGPSTRSVAQVWKAITPAAVLSFEEVGAQEEALIRGTGIAAATVLLSAQPGQPTGLSIPEHRTGRLQVEHLAAAGHRRIGYALPADQRVADFATPRLEGARLACADLGLELPVAIEVPLTPEGAAQSVQQWQALDPPVTAVCAYNDEVAMAVLAGAATMGLRVPTELAVIGVDDIPVAAVAVPPLTTVRYDMPRFAEFVADSVVAGLDGTPEPRTPGSHHLEVVRRESA